MNPRTFNKETLMMIIVDRPAMVRHLVNPTPDVIARVFFRNHKTFNYAPREWRNKEVLAHYIEYMRDNQWVYARNLDNFPRRVREEADINQVRSLVEKHCDAIKYFSLPYEDWKKYVSSPSASYTYNDIPSDIETEDLLVAAIEHNRDFAHGIPDSKWNPTLAERALKVSGDIINFVPRSLMTLDLYKIAFKTSPELSLQYNISEENCDQELAEMVAQSGNSLSHLPARFITRDMCLAALKKDARCNIDYIPRQFRDEEVTIRVLCSDDYHYNMNTFYNMDTFKDHTDHPLCAESKTGYAYWMKQEDFPVHLAQRDQELWEQDHLYKLYGMKNFLEMNSMSQETWLKVIEVSPISLAHIEKTDQTPEIINAFLMAASPAVLDDLAEKINLTLIKKDHAALLVGCENSVLQGIAERKLRGKQKAKKLEDIKPTVDTVILDLTEAEYRDIMTKYGRR
jgi:DNA-binding XRE family transcriptional regulator